MINAAQAAEHYEIVRYGTLVAWAKRLGRDDCASLLQQSLDEEKATDEKLTALADSEINIEADGADETGSKGRKAAASSSKRS